MPEVLVRARGLTKRFGSFTTVDGINFDLFRGEAFGFLGPNGAGKSSTMRMLGCISPPTSGYLTILGGDPVRDGSAIRSRLGVVPQEDTLDNELTVRENLLVYGRYFGLPRKLINERTDQLLDFVQLTERADDQVDPLSGGMKRRLTIARSLINDRTSSSSTSRDGAILKVKELQAGGPSREMTMSPRRGRSSRCPGPR